MSEEAQRVYLTNKMKAAAPQIGLPTAFPNHEFDIPKNAPYAEFHIISGPKPIIIGSEGKGKRRVRRVGIVQLSVWLPSKKGTKTATVAADVFKGLFQFKQGRDSSGSTYKFDVMQPMPVQSKTGWECHIFRVSFQRDSIEDVQLTL